MGKAHPNIFEIVDVIKKKQATTEINLEKFAAGTNQPPMKEEIMHLMRLIVVIPLLESEMVIDPGLVIVIDKVIDVQLWSSILLNSLPCYSDKTWGNKAGGCCLLHKAFEDPIPRSVQILQLQSLDLWPNCLGVMVVAARVQWSEFNRKTLMWAC